MLPPGAGLPAREFVPETWSIGLDADPNAVLLPSRRPRTLRPHQAPVVSRVRGRVGSSRGMIVWRFMEGEVRDIAADRSRLADNTVSTDTGTARRNFSNPPSTSDAHRTPSRDGLE
jgi:hypothetical protein